MSKMKEFIKALEEDKAYGWMCNNGYSMRVDELVDIIKEYDFAVQTMNFGDTKEDVHAAIIEELNMRYEEEDE